MKTKNKIIVLIIAVALITLSLGAISAADNSTNIVKEKQPTKCKVIIKSVTAKEGQNKKIIGYIKDNKNKPIKSTTARVTEIHNGDKKSYDFEIDNKGRYIDNTLYYKLGKTKIIIKSKDPRYTFSGRFYVTIKPNIKHVILKCPKDIYYTKKGISAYYTLGGQDNPGVYARVDGRSSLDGSIDKKILVAAFYFKNNKNGKFIVRTTKGHTYSATSWAYYHLIKGYTPFYVKVWYTLIS